MTNQNSKAKNEQTIHKAEQIYQRLLHVSIQETLTPNPNEKNPALGLNLRVWKQSILCRVKDLTEAALVLHRKDCHVAAAILVRALLETVALYYHIFTGMKNAIDTGNTEEAVNKLWKAGIGSHSVSVEGKDRNGALKRYDAIEIKESAKEFCDLVKAARRSYDQLSEIVHPNFSGCVSAYAEPDTQTLSFRFGKDFRHVEINYDYVLEFAIGFFELHYADMNKLVDEFLNLLE